jgi:hypothetical protein
MVANFVSKDDIGNFVMRTDWMGDEVVISKGDVGVLRGDIAVLKSDVAELKSDVAVL